MTKYVLHGGGIRGSVDEGKAYFEELAKGLGKQPRVLLCFFAQPEAVWTEKYEEWIKRIGVVSEAEPIFGQASVTDFPLQAQRHDILWIYGGDDELLKQTVSQIPRFVNLLQSFSVVAGSSAGAILLAKKSWPCDRRLIHDGLAVVNTNALVHYGSNYGSDSPLGAIDWQKAEAELRAAIGPDERISKLREGEFEVFTDESH